MGRKWSRRRFLEAAGITASVGAFAPLFPLPTAEAQEEVPKRLILVHTALGTHMETWRPTGTENDFVLSEQLAPLEPYKDRLLILDGVDLAANYAYGFPYGGQTAVGGHYASSGLWTGMPSRTGGTLTERNLRWPQGPSVDAIIASHVGEGTRFGAYHWGTWRTSRTVRPNTPDLMAFFAGADEPVPTKYDPRATFDEMFAGVSGDAEEVERLRQRRASVLDAVRGSLGRLQRELPAGDRQLLEAHLSQVRELEGRVGALEESCTPPEAPEEYGRSFLRDDANHEVLSQLHFAMMNNALACDLTRIACFHWYVTDFQPVLPGSLSPTAMHGPTHHIYDADASRAQRERDRLKNLQAWSARMLSEDLLGQMPDAVADNTTLVWASEMSEGEYHTNRNLPVVIYQGANLDYFKTNAYLRLGEGMTPEAAAVHSSAHAFAGAPPHNQLLTSLCHCMGVTSVDHVGDTERIPERGPLTAAMR